MLPGSLQDVEMRLGLRPRNLVGYLDWNFWHTPRRAKRREAKMDQASFFFLPCGGRPSRPLAPGGPPVVRGRSQGDPTPAQHLSPCGPTRVWPFTTATPTWKREDLLHCHARAVLFLDGGVQEERITTRRTPVARDTPATARWALGHALVGFRFLPFQPTRGRNNMTRDGGPRVCMEVPRGRVIGDRNLSESPFEQRPAPLSQWKPIQVVGQTPPCLPPFPWC